MGNGKNTNQSTKEIKYDARLWVFFLIFSQAIAQYTSIYYGVYRSKRMNGRQRDDSFSIGLSWMEDTIRTIVRNRFFRSYGIEKFVSR